MHKNEDIESLLHDLDQNIAGLSDRSDVWIISVATNTVIPHCFISVTKLKVGDVLLLIFFAK